MEQYISKSAVVAELEDWRDKIKKGIFSIPLCGNERAYATFEYEVLGKVISFLDTLEVKDFELTWEDVAWIVNKAILQCRVESTLTAEDICKDVLRQFKAQKGK